MRPRRAKNINISRGSIPSDRVVFILILYTAILYTACVPAFMLGPIHGWFVRKCSAE
jgi:hypothetical protein